MVQRPLGQDASWPAAAAPKSVQMGGDTLANLRNDRIDSQRASFTTRTRVLSTPTTATEDSSSVAPGTDLVRVVLE